MPEPVALYQGSQRQGRLPSCAISNEDLQRFYRALQRKADEIAEQLIGRLEKRPDQSEEQFEAVKKQVRELCAVTIVIQGEGGEQIIASSSDALAPDSLPDPILGILFDTAFMYRVTLGQNPLDRAEVRLDFRRPPLLDISNVSGAPPPNESAFFVIGSNTSWVSAVHEAVTSTFSKRILNRRWLYTAHSYDLLLLSLGLPMSLWLSARLGSLFDQLWPTAASPLPVVARVYLFFVALYGFRLSFSIARWIFPYVELSGATVPGTLTRLILGTIGLGVVSGFAYDLVKLAWAAIG